MGKGLQILAPALLLIGSSAAWGSSSELISQCRTYVAMPNGTMTTDEAVGWQITTCFSFIKGFAEGWTTHQAVSGSANKRGDACFPRGVTWRQLVEVYVRWADQHPEKHHLDPWETVSTALSVAFPCNEQGQK